MYDDRVRRQWSYQLTRYTGWLPQVFGQDYPLSQTSEAAHARCIGSSARCLIVHSSSAWKPRACAATSQRNLGLPDMLVLEPGAIEL